nr:RHS repeat-associated core domain-containing protein [uncultured Rhodoferax sp.]
MGSWHVQIWVLSSQGLARTEYLWLPTETGQAELVGLYQNDRFYAVHTDHLGTPRKVTDDAGKVAWQWAYSAFGDNKPTGPLKSSPKVVAGQTINMLKATQPTVMLNLRFPGQYWDDEAKLSYNYFRSYQPGQGRYSQPDPIGLAGGWSRFTYVDVDPLGAIDPEGLAAEHTKNARPSTQQKHQEAEARRARDAGGEKGDKSRRPPSKKPPGYKGPWPMRGIIPLVCPLCEIMEPPPIPGPELC